MTTGLSALAAWALLVACTAPGRPRLPDLPEPAHPAPTGDTGPTTSDGPRDSDGDGFTDDQDCAPDDPEVNPFAMELCNGLDDDCDGAPDPHVDRDADGDGFRWCDECDDADPDAYPGAPDPIDGVDQDCDGTDGQGEALTGSAYRGATWRALLGFELAAADFDGDGCDDLLIGQPSDPTLPSRGSSVSLRPGCGDGALTTWTGGQWIATDLDLAPGYLVFSDLGSVGRTLVFDSEFAPGALPRLELRYAGQFALLGTPTEWLATSRFDFVNPQHYNLVSVERTGLLLSPDDEADVQVWTDSLFPYTGYFLADVGDRDGDGEADLAYGQPEPGVDTVYFFPQIYEAHVDDAPERWIGIYGTFPGFGVAGDADLDGDGLDDGLVRASHDHGQQLDSGVVYVTPWRPGEHSLVDDAPARIDGEFTQDWTGSGMSAADLDGDGADDLVVGAPGDWVSVNRAGKVMVFSGPLSGTYTAADADRLWVGEHLGDHAGRGLALGDFDGSGQRDIAIGAPFARGDADEAGGAVYLLHDPL